MHCVERLHQRNGGVPFCMSRRQDVLIAARLDHVPQGIGPFAVGRPDRDGCGSGPSDGIGSTGSVDDASRDRSKKRARKRGRLQYFVQYALSAGLTVVRERLAALAISRNLVGQFNGSLKGR
jgi:hypothetical protein